MLNYQIKECNTNRVLFEKFTDSIVDVISSAKSNNIPLHNAYIEYWYEGKNHGMIMLNKYI